MTVDRIIDLRITRKRMEQDGHKEPHLTYLVSAKARVLFGEVDGIIAMAVLGELLAAQKNNYLLMTQRGARTWLWVHLHTSC